MLRNCESQKVAESLCALTRFGAEAERATRLNRVMDIRATVRVRVLMDLLRVDGRSIHDQAAFDEWWTEASPQLEREYDDGL